MEHDPNSLNDRIRKARAESEQHGTIEKQQPRYKPNPGSYASSKGASEFIASIIAGAVVGAGFDWLFGSKPFLFLIFMILGFISGTYRATQSVQKKE